MKPDIWMDGRFVPWDGARIHPLSHGIQRGAALFESIDCNETVSGRPAIFRLRDHIRRFEHSAEIVGMPLPYTAPEMEQAVIDTVARSGLANCTIRPLALWTDPTFDLSPGDSPVSLVIGIEPAHTPSGSYRLKVSGWRKADALCMPVGAKVSGNYIAPLIAKHEAIAEGFDDVILLDRDGSVAESTTANIFIVEAGRLVTAPDDIVLPGVTRDSIMEIAGAIGIGFLRERFGPGRLLAADEVIRCSSGKEVRPVVAVNGQTIGNGGTGPVTARLGAFYGDVIAGRVPAFERWLTYLP